MTMVAFVTAGAAPTGVQCFTHTGRNLTKLRTGRSSFVARRPRVPLDVPGVGIVRMAKGDTSPQGQQPTAKELAQLYGGSYLGTSIGLSIVSYIALYFMVAAGVDVRALVNALGDWLATTPVGRPSVLDSIPDTASTATLAYIAHKAISFLRFPITVAATPVVARAFSKKGSEDSGTE